MWTWLAIGLGVVVWFQWSQMRSMAKDISRLKQLYDAVWERLLRLESGRRVTQNEQPVRKVEKEESVEQLVDVTPPPLPVIKSAPAPVAVKKSIQEPVTPTSEDKWGQWEQEQVLGLRWTTWVGGLILFLGMGLFVKYSFDRNWLGDWTKVGLGLVAGSVLLGMGEFVLRRKMTWLGQGLMGVGLAVMYVAAFGAYAFYELLPHATVFLVMIGITLLGMSQAVRHNALSMAFMAVLGGFLTPVLMSKGENARDALFAYVLLLDLGVLAVAWFKQWRFLDVLAFLGTMLLFGGWFAKFNSDALIHWQATVLWLVCFYAVFLLAPFVYHLRLATPVTGERFVLAVTNAMGLFCGLYTVLHGEHRVLLSVLTVGMSGTYLGMGVLIRERIKDDAKAVLGCAALFVSLLTLAVPIALDLYAVTIAWAIEAPLLLFLACVYAYQPLRIGSVVPLCLAVGRLFVFHWPLHTESFQLFFNASMGTGVFVVLAGGVFTWLCHRHAQDEDEHRAKWVVGVASVFLGLFLLHQELWLWLKFERHADMQYLLSLIWTVSGAMALCLGQRYECKRLRDLTLAFAGIALIWVAKSYLGQRYSGWLFLNLRFMVALASIGLLMAFGFVIRRFEDLSVLETARLAYYTFVVAVIGLFAWLNVETYQFAMMFNSSAQKSHWAAHMGLSLIWGLYATGLLIFGFARRVRPARLAALGLFGVTALKLVFVDLAGVQEVFRIISFIVLGLLLIAASYLYHRAEKQISEE